MAGKLVDEHTTDAEAERLFRRAKNARRQERRDEAAAARPEPAKPEPIVELTEIVGELIELIERMTIDQPIYHRPLERIKERINELRYG